MKSSRLFKLSPLLVAALFVCACSKHSRSTRSDYTFEAVTAIKTNPNGSFSGPTYAINFGDEQKHMQQAKSRMALTLPEVQLKVGEKRTLRIFHINDLRNHITLTHKKKGDTHLVSQMVKRVKAARKKAKADEVVLFLDAGDSHTGAIFDELYGYSVPEFVIDPSYHAFCAAGVDAVVLGNHEFDHGTQLLAHAINTNACFPILASNTHGSQYIRKGVQIHDAIVTQVKGLRIAMLGLTTPKWIWYRKEEDPNLRLASPMRTLEKTVPVLNEYADVIILLSHVGYQGKGTDVYGSEADYYLAKRAAQLTNKPLLLVGGHSHSTLHEIKLDKKHMPGGVLVVQAGRMGQYIGEVVMQVDRTSRGMAHQYQSARLHKTKKHDSDYDRGFERRIVKPMLKKLDKKLGQSFATMQAAESIETKATTADRYMRETALANLINDAVLERSKQFPGGKVDVAVVNATGLYSGLPAKGKVDFNHFYSAMPYGDWIQVAEMSGRQLRDLLNSNAKRVLRPEEAKSGKYNVDLFVHRGFLHFSKSVRYKIKLGKDAVEAKAIDIAIHGKPLKRMLSRTFRVAFSNYIGNGGYKESWNGQLIGDGVPGKIVGYNLKAIPKMDTDLIHRKEVINFVKAHKVITPELGASKDGRLVVVP